LTGSILPIAPGLLERFRQAGSKIAWRPAARSPGKPTRPGGARRARIAHLNDEESRVEDDQPDAGYRIVTDSGPVGALVLVLEIDRRGPPDRLRAHEAGKLPGFPSGSLEAVWGAPPRKDDPILALPDLIGLARYALA
jgi:hypothetical protein